MTYDVVSNICAALLLGLEEPATRRRLALAIRGAELEEEEAEEAGPCTASPHRLLVALLYTKNILKKLT